MERILGELAEGAEVKDVCRQYNLTPEAIMPMWDSAGELARPADWKTVMRTEWLPREAST